ncbi:MAG: hypothetical protein CXX69_01120, partial [Candidatus Thalassarchaeum betae]
MVAGMPLTIQNDKTAFGLRTTDLRNVAIGFAVAIALVMVAGQISDSGSDSASATYLEDSAEKRFADPTIAVTSVAGGDGVDYDEYVTNGFTVTGLTSNADDECAGSSACTVTVDYGGVERTSTVASDNSFTVTFSAAQLAAGNGGSGVADGTSIDVTASVTNPDATATVSLTVEQDATKPTMTITSNT